jgi:excisionase family DNA binding protein
MMTKLITIPKFAEATGLTYRLCLQLVGTGQIPSVPVGRRRRIDVRWVEQWLASGGYRSSRQQALMQRREGQFTPETLTTAE